MCRIIGAKLVDPMYQFSDLNGTVGKVSADPSGGTSWQSFDGIFTGQGGLVEDCTNTATATPLNQDANLSATVQQTMNIRHHTAICSMRFFTTWTWEINLGNARWSSMAMSIPTMPFMRPAAVRPCP